MTVATRQGGHGEHEVAWSDDRLPLVLLVMAVAEEAADVAALVRRNPVPGAGSRRPGVARVGGCRLRLTVCGTGPRNAAAATAAAMEHDRPAVVVCAGLAGALHADLRAGDLVVATRVIDMESEGQWDCDPALVTLAGALTDRPVPSPAEGRVLITSPRIVGSAAEKARLSPRAALVDMESAAVARAAHARGIPFVAIRVVSDVADEDFPIDINRYVDARGNLQRARLAAAALCRPRGLMFLLHMRKTAMAASRTLSVFMEAFCRRLPTPS